MLLLPILSIIPVSIIVLWSIVKHRLSWYDPVGQSYIIIILLMPLVYSYCQTVSLLLGTRYTYLSIPSGIYEAIVLYNLFLLSIHYYNREAALYFRVDDSFQHSEKCIVNDRYKRIKMVYLFSLSSNASLVSIRYMIIQYLSIRIMTSIILVTIQELNYLEYQWIIGILNHISLIISIVSLFIFIYLVEIVIWMYDPFMQWAIVCPIMPILAYQSILFINHRDMETIVVNIEMFFIIMYMMWGFSYDREISRLKNVI